jgi:hypothetical protein
MSGKLSPHLRHTMCSAPRVAPVKTFPFVLFLMSSSAFAFARDPLPYFTPDVQQAISPGLVEYGPALPHPLAAECAVDDAVCVEAHESSVLARAMITRSPTPCRELIKPQTCIDAVAFVNGETGQDSDPMLTDPCTFVVLVDGKAALLYSRTLRRSRRILNRGWKASTFIGACDVTTLTTVHMGPTPAVPAFPWSPPVTQKERL